MQLTLWTYEGPPHVGALRVATAMRGLHYVLHAPQGDTYADLLFTMIERRDHRPPVTYTTFQARDLGGDGVHQQRPRPPGLAFHSSHDASSLTGAAPARPHIPRTGTAPFLAAGRRMTAPANRGHELGSDPNSAISAK